MISALVVLLQLCSAVPAAAAAAAPAPAPSAPPQPPRGTAAAEPERARRTAAEIAAELARTPERFEVRVVASVAGEDILGALWPRRGPGFDEPFVVTGPGGEKRLADRPHAEAAVPLLEKAEQHFRAERFDEAAKLYEAAAEKDPACYDCWSFAGDCFYFSDRPAEALVRYKRALDLHPMGHRAYFYLGKVFLTAGHREGGLELLQIALTLRPDWRTLLDAVAASSKALEVEVPPQPLLRPPGFLREEEGRVVVVLAREAPAHWRSYLECKALWRASPEGCDLCGPGSRLGYRAAEERECARVLHDAYAARPAPAPADPALERLGRVIDAGLLDAFLLYEVAPRNVPGATLLVERPARLDVGRYVREHVLVDVKR